MNIASARTLLRAATALAVLLIFADSITAQTNAPDRPNPMAPPMPRRPNIVLILADNIGYGDVGCYGQTKIKTPNLDRLAKQGMRFTSFYAGSPDDTEARAAWMAGEEPRHIHGGFNQPISASTLTVAELLKGMGFHTGLIGLWGLGDTPSLMPGQKGFDEFGGYLNSAHAQDYYADRIWRTQIPPTRYDGLTDFPQNRDKQHVLYLPGMLSLMSANFARNNKPEPFNHYRPFFLCLTYPVPHNSPGPGNGSYATESWTDAEKNRAAIITRMDEDIGKLMDRLAELKINTNTVVLFSSVGGPRNESGSETKTFNSTGSLRGLQGSVYEGGLRVPLIVHWPAQIKPGQVSELPCAAWDFVPTAAEIAMSKAPETLDGISFLPTLLGRKQVKRHETFYWRSTGSEVADALRTGDWKLVQNGTNAPELYNLKSDPSEKQNVAEKTPEIVAKAEKILGGLKAH
jgi:arylsulfatase A-like enzyme